MTALMKINSQGNVRIPKNILQKLHIGPGDFVEAEIDDHYKIILKPRKLIDPSQEWFYTKEWQKNEKDADQDIQDQNLSPVFSSLEEGLKWLKK